jgi:hypothetical protein
MSCALPPPPLLFATCNGVTRKTHYSSLLYELLIKLCEEAQTSPIFLQQKNTKESKDIHIQSCNREWSSKRKMKKNVFFTLLQIAT